MQPTRLWRLACLLVLGSAALASCGKDEATKPSTTPQGGGGASAGTKGTPTGGDASGAVGGVSGSTGGSTTGGSTTNLGGDAGTGAQGFDAGAGGALGNGGNGGSGATAPSGEQLELCTRITGKVGHADAQARAFAKAVFADCDIRWVVPLGSDLDEYRQQLVVWSLEFWGCQGNPVTDFGLVWGTPELSAGDAGLLVDHYIATANAELALSIEERVDMASALNRLSEQLISSASVLPSQSSCMRNIGGAGGAAGAGGTAEGGSGGAQ
jgi:hypothetical protein